MKYFEKKTREHETREDKKEFYCLKTEHEGSSLHEVIRTLHGGCMPSDAIYELCSDIVESFEDFDSREDFESSEIGYFIYTGDSISFFADARQAVVNCWGDLVDYFGEADARDLDPNQYIERVSNSYVSFTRYQLADWAETEGVWGGQDA